MRRISNFLLSLFLVANLATACSTQRTVTRDVEYDRAGEPVTVERQTTTTENSRRRKTDRIEARADNCVAESSVTVQRETAPSLTKRSATPRERQLYIGISQGTLLLVNSSS